MQKGFVGIIVLIVVLILAGLGGAYYYANNKLVYFGKPQTPQITPVPSSTSDASRKPNDVGNNPVPDGVGETANWKMYTNTDHKYSFKYPNNWLDKTDNIYKQQRMVKLIFTENSKEYYFIVGAKERGLEGLVDGAISEDKNVRDIKYIKKTWSKANKPILITAIPNNFSVNGLFEMQLPDTNTKYYQNIFDQILSTFKFLDQNQDETANWKTYISKEGGYSVKYPENTKVYVNEAFSAHGIKTPLKDTTTFVSDVLPQINTNFQMSITFKSSNAKTLDDFINQNNACASIQTNFGKTLTLDGRQAVIFENTPCGVSGTTLIYEINSGLGFIFAIETRGSYNDIKNYIDRILSTFKFIP